MNPQSLSRFVSNGLSGRIKARPIHAKPKFTVAGASKAGQRVF